MEHSIFTTTVSTLIEQPENDRCFDCRMDDPQFVSVNNGVFLCSTCSIMHKALGAETSYVRPLTDNFSDTELKMLAFGGNRSLREFYEIYNLCNEPTYTKYRTKAAEYYRMKLQSLALNQNHLIPLPDIFAGRELITVPTVKSYSRDIPPVEKTTVFKTFEPVIIEKEYIITEVKPSILETHLVRHQELPLEELPHSKTFGETFVDNVKSAPHKLMETLEEHHAKEKMQTLGKDIANFTMNVGGYLLDKTKQAATAIAEKTIEVKNAPETKKAVHDFKEGAAHMAVDAKNKIAGLFKQRKPEKRTTVTTIHTITETTEVMPKRKMSENASLYPYLEETHATENLALSGLPLEENPLKQHNFNISSTPETGFKLTEKESIPLLKDRPLEERLNTLNFKDSTNIKDSKNLTIYDDIKLDKKSGVSILDQQYAGYAPLYENEGENANIVKGPFKVSEELFGGENLPVDKENYSEQLFDIYKGSRII